MFVINSTFTLLSPVAQPAGLVGSGRPRRTMKLGELSVLPHSDPEQESKHVALLLAVQLLDVFVGAHCLGPGSKSE